jgi:hypothetical protein
VIGLGLRLAVAGGRAAITQLVMIAAAVAIGSCMLLTTLAVLHAVQVQNDRYAWLETEGVNGGQPVDDTVDALWWRLSGDVFDGELIGRVDLAPTGPDAPIPPGIPELPAAGEIYVSPALAELLGRTPAAQLADRFPATVVGTIGREALASPDSLIAIVGHEAADLATSDATLVREISTTGPDECGGNCAPFVGTKSAGMTLIIWVAAAAVLLPVLVFIAGATRLSAARREQRFAAMRLVGATPRQIGVVASVEAALAASAGVVVGVGLFVALRPLLAQLPFATERFFAGDLTLAPRDVVLVGIGIPIAAAVAARVALRRVITSPLAVTRQATARPTRVWRVIRLFAGIAWLAYLAWFTDIGASHNTRIQAVAYFAGIVSIMIGLVVAGPWVTAVAARLTARRAARPAALIAARRLGDDPHTAFRAISAVVVAVFVASGAIGAITSVVANNGGAADTSAQDRGTLVTDTVIATDHAVPFDDQDRADLLAVPASKASRSCTATLRPPGLGPPARLGTSRRTRAANLLATRTGSRAGSSSPGATSSTPHRRSADAPTVRASRASSFSSVVRLPRMTGRWPTRPGPPPISPSNSSPRCPSPWSPSPRTVRSPPSRRPAPCFKAPSLGTPGCRRKPSPSTAPSTPGTSTGSATSSTSSCWPACPSRDAASPSTSPAASPNAVGRSACSGSPASTFRHCAASSPSRPSCPSSPAS